MGGGTVNVLGHLGPSGVFLRASFFLFLIYNYNIYEYINIANVCESGASTSRVLGSEGKGHKNLSFASASVPVLGKFGLHSHMQSYSQVSVSCLLQKTHLYCNQEDPCCFHWGWPLRGCRTGPKRAS